MPTVVLRVHEKMPRLVRQAQPHVVAIAEVPAEVRGHAERRGEVDPGVPFNIIDFASQGLPGSQ